MGVRFKERSGFDWYQATIEADYTEVLDQLTKVFPTATTIEPGGGMYGFQHRLKGVSADGEQAWMLLYGGQNEYPNLSVTGDHADDWALACRELFPSHRVTRADVAIDRVQPGLFDDVLAGMIERTLRARMKPQKAGDWDSDERSRTQYAGSPSSRVRVRLYEKGMEIRQKHGRYLPGTVEDVSPHWVRGEVQIRPNSEHESRVVAQTSADALWGVSAVSRHIIEQLSGLPVEPLHMRTVKVIPPLERKLHNAIQQYRLTFGECIEAWGETVFVNQLLDGVYGRKVSLR